MFGGICFLKDGKMCVGVLKHDLIVRIHPDHQPELLKQKHVRPFDFTGKPAKGMVFVGPLAAKTEAQLKGWVTTSLEFVRSLPDKKK